jgi:hypothetical protein
LSCRSHGLTWACSSRSQKLNYASSQCDDLE